MTDSDSQQQIASDADFAIAESASAIADETPLALPSLEAPPPVVSSAIWTVVGFGIMQPLKLVSNLILTHLVEKYVFGVMTTINLFLQGLHLLSDLGLRQCVIRSPQGDDARYLRTAWTIQVIRGFVLLLVSIAIAWPLGWFYAQPEMYWLIPLFGLTAVCDGFYSSAYMTMQRHVRLGPLVIREIGAYVIGMATLVAGLVVLRWSLTPHQSNPRAEMFFFGAGNVLIFGLEMAFTFTLIRGHRDAFAWDPAAARDMLHFGGWIFISSALTFLANNFDRLYVGKISQVALADYNIAAQLARLPAALIQTMGLRFVLPLYGRLAKSGMPFDVSFSRLHLALTGFAAFLVSGVMATGPTVVWLLYSDDYHSAGNLVTWLSIAAWFTILQISSEAAVMAQGQTRQLALGQGVKLALLLPLLIVGQHYYGIAGVIAGYTIAEASRYVVLSASLAKQGLPVLRLDLIPTLLITVTAGAAILAGPHLEGSGDGFSRYGLRFLGQTAIIITAWFVIAAIWWRRNGRETLSTVRLGGATSG